MSRYLEIKELGVTLLKETCGKTREEAEVIVDKLFGYIPNGRTRMSIKQLLDDLDSSEVEIFCRDGDPYF